MTVPGLNESDVGAEENDNLDFVPMDWLAGDLNAWLDEDSDLMSKHGIEEHLADKSIINGCIN
ncbi:uncharacterized protein N7477_006910 [Penicillium maclennaniae]|uniref:uncharacterized protein n=1 Tax=Penicillium maclennaniae TaxID=1343394 RepID=UPI0025419A59|nr:uncharacterized protein N7477_006910 [Penicillium maclennaniae]KAJ5668340.1 hypothetical protein N7477_006910 [Penicillium maclennaniae]